MLDRMRRFLKESWQVAPGACVAVPVITISFVIWVIYSQVAVEDLSVLIGLVVWLMLAAAAVRFGVMWDLGK